MASIYSENCQSIVIKKDLLNMVPGIIKEYIQTSWPGDSMKALQLTREFADSISLTNFCEEYKCQL